jgi:chemosensory pili system protein ChpA (sensor histidine kinase/response regulator)
MRTRMVPFQRHVQRLSRIVRQAAADTGKQAELVVEGASGELDRQVLERMLPPFEHLLRNAVVHGIEDRREARSRRQAETAASRMSAAPRRRRGHRRGRRRRRRHGPRGDPRKAIELGLIRAGPGSDRRRGAAADPRAGLLDRRARLTQQAGRGVGMDVVATEIKKLGGALHMETVPGRARASRSACRSRWPSAMR